MKGLRIFLAVVIAAIIVLTSGFANGVLAQTPTVDELIEKLGDDDWRTREQATKDLIEMGKDKTKTSEVLREVRRAKYHSDPEIRMRARLILREVVPAVNPSINEIRKKIDDRIQRWLNWFIDPPWDGVWNSYIDAKETFLRRLATCDVIIKDAKGEDVNIIEEALDDLINVVKLIGERIGDPNLANALRNELTDDSDGDGMPYWWEMKWGLDTTKNDAGDDLDHDKVPNIDEYKNGTNPNDEDTDGDGTNDGKDTDPLQHAYFHTPTGLNVLVSLGKEATVLFSNVTVEGCTVLYPFPTPTYTPPSGYGFVGYSYDIYTTVQYAGPITVTFPYDESWLLGKETELKLFHWNNHTLEWEDVTVSIDTLNNIITGSGYSLSPFVMAEPGGERDLPADALMYDAEYPGDTFDVYVNFTAPEDDFNSIGLTDLAPDGWEVEANNAWCDPVASYNTSHGNKVEYAWAASYTNGTNFSAMYKVTIPQTAKPGINEWPKYIDIDEAWLEYYFGEEGPYKSCITGEWQKMVTVPGTVCGETRDVNANPLPDVEVLLKRGVGSPVTILTDESTPDYSMICNNTGDNYWLRGVKARYDTLDTRVVGSISPHNVNLSEYIDWSTPELLAVGNVTDFEGDYGLVPMACDMSYALRSVNLWLFWPAANEEWGLSVWKAMQAVDSWQNPK